MSLQSTPTLTCCGKRFVNCRKPRGHLPIQAVILSVKVQMICRLLIPLLQRLRFARIGISLRLGSRWGSLRRPATPSDAKVYNYLEQFQTEFRGMGAWSHP